MIVKPKRLVLLLAGVLLLVLGAAIFLKVPGAQTISSALDDTIIKEFTFRKATPDETFSSVMNHFHEKHPELRKVHLDYYPTAEAVRLEQVKALWGALGKTGSPPAIAPEWDSFILASLQNIPATEALKYATGLSGLEYVVRPGKICIYAPKNPPPPSFRERLASILNWFRSLFSKRLPPERFRQAASHP